MSFRVGYHPWILLLAVLLMLARPAIRFYRLARAMKNIKVVRKAPEPDDYLDDVFGKGNRP